MQAIDTETLHQLAAKHGTPLFIYSQPFLSERAELLLQLDLPFGLTARYAAKANTHPEIIRLFDEVGLHFDASSSYEATELIKLGIASEKISLSSQQPAHNLDELLKSGVQYVATSLHQLELVCRSAAKPSTVGLRVNPGLGAGHNNRTTTGGANSSFGLWHTYIPKALELAKQFGITIDKVHVHVGSGADPTTWGTTMDTALELIDQLPDVTVLDIGGGYKIHRFGDEQEADMQQLAAVFSQKLQEYADRTGRKLKLEIEPGTWLVAHAGVLVAEAVDIVDTGNEGHTFIRLNTGMNDIIRPSMYGAQHEMRVLNDATETHEYVVVGHNCETGDILTPAPGDSEGIEPRTLQKAAIGDLLAIYDAGAYCASFSAHGYNAYPNAKEVVYYGQHGE